MLQRLLNKLRRIKMNNLDQFKVWLQENKSFDNKKVYNDIISRIRRTDRLCSIENYCEENIDEYLFHLMKIDEVKGLSSSVRSQLKRAVLLYKEYLSQNNQ